MRNGIVTANADGVIRGAAGEGIGFLFEPAGDNPGTFPIVVHRDGVNGRELTVSSPREMRPGPFRELEVSGALPFATYNLHVIEAEHEKVGETTGPISTTRTLEILHEPTKTPEDLAEDSGFLVLPTWRALSVYPRHVADDEPIPAVDLEVWIATIAGRWLKVETIPAADVAVGYLYREVGFPGGRITFAAPADVDGSLRLEIDLKQEIG